MYYVSTDGKYINVRVVVVVVAVLMRVIVKKELGISSSTTRKPHKRTISINIQTANQTKVPKEQKYPVSKTCIILFFCVCGCRRRHTRGAKELDEKVKMSLI